MHIYELPPSIRGVTKKHAAAGTAEEVTGVPPFLAGTVIQLSGNTATLYVGATKLEAEAHKFAIGVYAHAVRILLPKTATTFWVDTGANASYTATQIHAVD